MFPQDQPKHLEGRGGGENEWDGLNKFLNGKKVINSKNFK